MKVPKAIKEKIRVLKSTRADILSDLFQDYGEQWQTEAAAVLERRIRHLEGSTALSVNHGRRLEL